MPRSHLHVNACSVRATIREWDVAISWELWGLRDCYGVYVVLCSANIALPCA